MWPWSQSKVKTLDSNKEAKRCPTHNSLNPITVFTRKNIKKMSTAAFLMLIYFTFFQLLFNTTIL